MKNYDEVKGTIVKDLYLGIGHSTGHLYVRRYADGSCQLELDDTYGARTLTISKEFYEACLKEFDGRFTLREFLFNPQR